MYQISLTGMCFSKLVCYLVDTFNYQVKTSYICLGIVHILIDACSGICFSPLFLLQFDILTYI